MKTWTAVLLVSLAVLCGVCASASPKLPIPTVIYSTHSVLSGHKVAGGDHTRGEVARVASEAVAGADVIVAVVLPALDTHALVQAARDGEQECDVYCTLRTQAEDAEGSVVVPYSYGFVDAAWVRSLGGGGQVVWVRDAAGVEGALADASPRAVVALRVVSEDGVEADATALLRAVRASAAASSRKVAVVVTADAPEHTLAAQVFATPQALRQPRSLSYEDTREKKITPTILTGLIVGFILLYILFWGVNVMLSLQTPTRWEQKEFHTRAE